MRIAGDQERVREAIMRAAAAAYPGVLERADLDREPAIAAADGRTVQGEIRRLMGVGCITPVEQEIPSGRVLRMRATDPAAIAVRAVLVTRG